MNEVYLVGTIKGIKTGEGQFGKWAFFTIVTTKKVKEKTYSTFISCVANGYGAERVSTISEGTTVMANGTLKALKNREEKWDLKVSIKVLYPIAYTPNSSPHASYSAKPPEQTARQPATEAEPPITDEYDFQPY